MMTFVRVRVYHLIMFSGPFFLVLVFCLPITSTSFSIPTPTPTATSNSHSSSSLISSSSSPSSSSTSTSTSSLVHTLILCRHGDSIWNGGQPGTRETFTGWTDVPLSEKGLVEAKTTATELSSSMLWGQMNMRTHASTSVSPSEGGGGGTGGQREGNGAGINLNVNGLDACFTSILGRARQTAHYCCWAFADLPQSYNLEPKKYVSDWRLNERHYGSLQGYVKADVERGVYGHDPVDVERWRRAWHAIPPLLDDDDPRRIEEVRKFGNFCGGEENVPRGESLEMVARDRIRPFLDEVLHPTLEGAALSRIAATMAATATFESSNEHFRTKDSEQCNGEIGVDNDKNIDMDTVGRGGRQDGGGAGLVVAHANSLRALIGVICDVEKDPAALKRLEAMKIQTGVPLILKYTRLDDGRYQACDLMLEMSSSVSSDHSPEGQGPNGGTSSDGSRDLPIWPLSSIPRGNVITQQMQIINTRQHSHHTTTSSSSSSSSSHTIMSESGGNKRSHNRMENPLTKENNEQRRHKRQPTIRIDVI